MRHVDDRPSPMADRVLVVVALMIVTLTLGAAPAEAGQSGDAVPSPPAGWAFEMGPLASPEPSPDDAASVGYWPWASLLQPSDVASTDEGSTAATTTVASVPTALRLEASYDTSLRLDWGSRRVRVRTSIAVRNTTNRAFERVDLTPVVAVRASMRALEVRVDGVPVAARVRGQTIRVPLPGGLAVGEDTVIRAVFRARLRTTTAARSFFWTRTGGVAQMYRFIPWLSRRIPFGRIPIGEPFLTAVSPTVRLTVRSDRRLVWATSGQRVSKDGRRETFVAHDVRDMSVAASPGFRTRRGTSTDGRVDIIVYTRMIDGRRLLRLARQELARLQRKVGVRYPYPTYRVAESGGGLAMESPGLVWVPGRRSAFDLPFLVSHETAHQWFYALVGNDQATDAFADEALAEYFSRHARGVLRPSRCRLDRLDRRIFDYPPSCYYEVIYVQGALFLDKLRRDLGNAKFRRAVHTYTRDHRLGIGSNRALLEALRTEMGDAVLKRFRARFPSLY